VNWSEFIDNVCLFSCLFQIKAYEKLETAPDRQEKARSIYDNYIMKELLSRSHVSTNFSYSYEKFYLPQSSLKDFCKKSKKCDGLGIVKIQREGNLLKSWVN